MHNDIITLASGSNILNPSLEPNIPIKLPIDDNASDL